MINRILQDVDLKESLFDPVYHLEGETNVWSQWYRTANLIKHLTWRNLAMRYRGSALGFAWSLLNPAFLMATYTFTFHFIFRATSTGVPFPVFLLTGILAWNFLSVATMSAGGSLVDGANLINKAAFPRIALPISAGLSSGLNYVAALPLLIICSSLFGVAPTQYLLLLPFVVLLLLLMAIAIGLLLAGVMPLFNDLQHLIEVLFPMWFFLTPVVYPISMVPDKALFWYQLNPMVGIMQFVHAVFLGQPLPGASLVIAVGELVCLLCFGLWIFNRLSIHCCEV